MKQLLNTLYVTSPDAYLRLEGETVCVELEHKKILQVPLHHLNAIVCFGDVVVTPPLMLRCTSDGKSIAFLNRRGEFAARVEGPVSGNVLLRIDQHRAFAEPHFVLQTARNIVAGKINNSRQIVLRGGREASSNEDREALNRISDLLLHLLKNLESKSSLDEIRGTEGEAAKLYFGGINYLIRQDQRSDFAMSGRSRRPPLDRFNALLSFLYTIATIDCRAAIECVGLDPQIGFLHTIRPGRPALALDLVEEFRSILADRVALNVVNRGQVRGEDFSVRPGGAVMMTDDARRTVIATYQKRKQEEITHPLLEDKVALGVIPHIQARMLARTIRGEMDEYLPYLYR